MASFNNLVACPIKAAVAISSAATIGTATVTKPTDAVRNTIAVFGIVVSGSVVPGAATTAVLSDGTTVFTFELTTTALATPFVFNFPAGHPFIAAAGNDVTLTTGSLGGAGVSSGIILYAYVTV
jgi:hypothetical protein